MVLPKSHGSGAGSGISQNRVITGHGPYRRTCREALTEQPTTEQRTVSDLRIASHRNEILSACVACQSSTGRQGGAQKRSLKRRGAEANTKRSTPARGPCHWPASWPQPGTLTFSLLCADRQCLGRSSLQAGARHNSCSTWRNNESRVQSPRFHCRSPARAVEASSPTLAQAREPNERNGPRAAILEAASEGSGSLATED